MATLPPDPLADDPNAADSRVVSRWRRWLLAPLLLLALLVAAVPAGLWFLSETAAGRGFVARQITGLPFDSGLAFEVERIDGSLLSSFTLVDVKVHDLDGLLATVPEAQVDWDPTTLLSRRISIDQLLIPEIRLLRMWRMNPGDPDAPILPNFDIRVDRFAITQLILEAPLLGRRELITANGRLDIRDGRLLMTTDADSESGDRLRLLIDAEPDGDRFDLEISGQSPADGMLATATGLGQPLAITADGEGTWSRWRGRVAAHMADAPLALLAVQGDGGRFRVTGTLTPGTLVPEAAAPLLAPAIAMDLTASRTNGAFDLRFVAATEALALTGGGQFDADDNRFIDTRADLLVRQPDKLHPQLSGQGLMAAVTVNGRLAAPEIQWTARADSIRFTGDNGPMGVNGLLAEGEVSLDPVTMPFSATVASTTGLPAEMQALLAQPRLTGTIIMDEGATRAHEIRLQTAMATATATATLSDNGALAADFTADIRDYAMEGLGAAAVNVSGAARQPADGALTVNGRFDVRTRRLDNESVAEFLGGPPRMAGQFALAPDGAIAVSRTDFTSPNLNFRGASARYDAASGRFALDAEGESRAYGPVAITASGTSTAPTATIRLASPGFGVGLSNVVADIEPANGAIRWRVSGQSPQGALDGNGLFHYGEGQPMAADIHAIRFAGISASGRVQQTPAGPFAGNLVVLGQGIDGNVRLAAQGAQQQVRVTATARSARLPLDPIIHITRGTMDLGLLFTPAGPQMAGSFDMAGIRRGTLALTSATGRFSHNGQGTAGRVELAGQQSGSQPFRAQFAVQSIPEGFAATLDGNVGRLPLRLEQPAQIVRADGGWELRPARLILPKGRISVAGNWGDLRRVRLVMEDVDLSVLNNLRSGLDISGSASGQVNVRLDPEFPVPLGAANIRISGLRRSGIGGSSIPVDVNLSARSSTEEGLLIGASYAWQGNQLGRVLVRGELGEGEDVAQRFANARLSGGVRYNGPVEPLWALAAVEGQELRGPVAIGADIGGTLASPQLSGHVRGSGMLYRNVNFGTEINNIGVEGRFRGSRLEISRLDGRTAGGGTLSGSGFVNLSLEQPAIDIRTELNRARLADSDMLSVTLSGPLRLAGTGTAAKLTGDLRVDDARVQLVQVETSEIPSLRVRREGEVRVPDPEPTLSAAALALDVRIRADDRINVQGMGLDSRWRADLQVRGTAANPQLFGSATLDEGDFTFASSRFNLTTGRVVFNGAPMESAINLQAETLANDVTAYVTIGGTAAQPEVAFSSTPSLPEDEILSRLLFGTSVAELSVTEAVQLATAVAGLQSGTDTMGKIRRSVGVDRLRLVGDDPTRGMGTGLAVGKRLTRNIYAEVITDSQGNTLATLQWSLSRTLSMLLEMASVGSSSANMRYQRDY